MAFAPPTSVNSKRRQQEIQKIFTKRENDLNTNDLFCLKCIKQGKYMPAFGFCKVCKDFLCKKCVDSHESSLMTLYHGIVTGSEMFDRYQHVIRKEVSPSKQTHTSHLGMLANDKATLHYTDEAVTNSTTSRSSTNILKESGSLTESRVKLSTDLQKCFICACLILSDGTVILADANNKNIKLFDKYFNWLSVFHMKKEPWDMCGLFDRSLHFYVTETQVNGVHQFRAGNEIQYLLTLKTVGSCFGVAAWGEGVAVSIKKDRKFEIQLMDKHGNIHQRIKDGPDMLMKTPWYLTSFRTKPLIIVSDSEARSVIGLNYEGKVEFVFKNRTELQDPRNVAADDDGNIYIVDYELNTVRQLSKDGQDKGVILCRKDGLRSPCGLACKGNLLYLQAKIDSTNLQVFLLK